MTSHLAMSTPRDDSAPASGASPADRPEGMDLDHECIQLAQGGDERAFESLVKRHEGRAFRVARNLVPSDEDARDLAQEAFLRVFRSLDRFDFQYPFTTWLNRIVTNLAIDHLRRRRPTARGEGGEFDEDAPGLPEAVDDSEPAPSRRLEADETAQRVRDCIAALAPHFQSVLTLRELEGLSCIEIADIVGATHVTVRWRLHRGRKLFAEEWSRRERLAESLSGTQTNDPSSAP